MNTSINSKSKNKGAVYLIASILLSVFFNISGEIFSAAISLVLCGWLFAVALVSIKGVWVILASALITPGAAFLLTGKPLCAVMSVGYVIVGGITAYCIIREKTRSETLARTALSVIGFTALVYGMIIFGMYGKINRSVLKEYVELNLSQIKYLFEYSASVYGNMPQNVPIDVLINQLTDTLRVAFGGYIVSFSCLIAFFVTALTKKTLVKTKQFPAFLGEWKFVMSKIGALIYIMAYAIPLFVTWYDGSYIMFALYIAIVGLSPAILYMCISYISSKINKPETRLSGIAGIFAIILFGSKAITILGLFGTFFNKSDVKGVNK